MAILCPGGKENVAPSSRYEGHHADLTALTCRHSFLSIFAMNVTVIVSLCELFDDARTKQLGAAKNAFRRIRTHDVHLLY
jgi:hypothetical protein